VSLIVFVVDNQNHFYTGLNVHILYTGNKNQLYIPTANLSAFQEVFCISGIRIFNRLVSNIQHLRASGVPGAGGCSTPPPKF